MLDNLLDTMVVRDIQVVKDLDLLVVLVQRRDMQVVKGTPEVRAIRDLSEVQVQNRDMPDPSVMPDLQVQHRDGQVVQDLMEVLGTEVVRGGQDLLDLPVVKEFHS